MVKMWIILVLVVSCIITEVTGKPTNKTQHANTDYCQPYCDAYGYYQRGKWCYADAQIDVYCCGSEHTRYCCTDKEKDVGDLYPPVNKCDMSSWWHYQWRVIIGLLGTVVVMLMLAACCYFCCGGSIHNRTVLRRRRRAAIQADQTEGRTREIVNNFDPSSPYAFTPPDYDSLPKEPPKYADIYDGIVNPGYVEVCAEQPVVDNAGIVDASDQPSISEQPSVITSTEESHNEEHDNTCNNSATVPSISSAMPNTTTATSAVTTTSIVPTEQRSSSCTVTYIPTVSGSCSSSEVNINSDMKSNEEDHSENRDSLSTNGQAVNSNVIDCSEENVVTEVVGSNTHI